MNCCDPNTRNIQLIEPDNLLLTTTSSGAGDASLREFGEEPLSEGQSEVTVFFNVVKASPNYRFEYLYVDAFGHLVEPGVINPVVVKASEIGFTVELAGTPPATGYTLKWRVVVIDTTVGSAQVDFPEVIYFQIPSGSSLLVVPFENPRSGINYGFTELRVENLQDPASAQRILSLQVVAKTILGFTVGINPRPNNDHYFIVARTP
jgi:hypothetical protein